MKKDNGQFHSVEYGYRVMEVVERLHDVLQEYDFDLSVNALLTAIAESGKQSTLSQDVFVTTVANQVSHIMDSISIVEHKLH